VIALTEERKRQIIDEQPGGLWLVLEEESSHAVRTPGDLLCGDPDDADA
jgi:hypothetical protein